MSTQYPLLEPFTGQERMLINLAAFVAALLLSLVFTRLVRSWATSVGLVDRPDGGRKTHARATPRAGGIGIYVSVALVLVGAIAFLPLESFGDERMKQFLATLVGGSAIFALGFLDDAFGLRARTKFGVEAAIALGMVWAGLSINGVNLPGGGYYEFPVWFSTALTVVWIVGITNAFNLIDGADGVAAGAAVFACFSLATILLLGGNELGGLAALTLAGATLGFLFYNFPPASIFLGDCGSLLLGFVLAAIGLMSAQAAPTLVAVAIPVVSVGLPLLDTLLAMTRRFLRRQPIFNPDRGHIHHRLRDLGHSPRTVALLLYGACATFSAMSLLLVRPSARMAGVLLVVLGVIIWIALQRLRIPELLEVGRIVDRGLRQRTVIAHNVRIREAAARLRAANDPFAIDEALRFALEESEFERAELWVDNTLGEPLIGTGLAVADGMGAIWRSPVAGIVGNQWEMRMQLRNDAGVAIGRFSLWHSADTEHVLTDVRLLASELQPALYRALERVAEESRREGKWRVARTERPLLVAR